MLIAAPCLAGPAGTLPLWAVWLLLARNCCFPGPWRAQVWRGPQPPAGGKAKTILKFLGLFCCSGPQSWRGPFPLGWMGLVVVRAPRGWGPEFSRRDTSAPRSGPCVTAKTRAPCRRGG
ncbi:MAG: hypothetical protein CM15mP77_1960 [Synechococcus sp.]|nr:MAG: hypothetical protein CM15mP77_1960 [Synechococcus sp.]